jgi:hypothetical protein
MEMTNTLAHYDTATITAAKSSIVQALGPLVRSVSDEEGKKVL